MATGSDTAPGGLGVPLFGDSEIKQRTAATDILTLTGATSMSGDFLVCRDVDSTELFVVNSTGALTVGAGDLTVTAGDVAITKGYFLRFSAFYTTGVPTTGLTLGDVFLTMQSSTVQIAVCTDSTQNTLAYFTQNTATFGRSTPS